MKNVIFLSFIALIFSGCSNDIKSLSKEECTNLGYKFKVEKRLNYRTGKHEQSTICLESKNKS